MNRSPTKKNSAPPGFRVPPKPKFNVATMSRRELQDHWNRNNQILATTSPDSQASYVPRLEAEQQAIEARIDELNQRELEADLGILSVGSSTAHLKAPAIRTKQRILASFAEAEAPSPTQRNGRAATASIGLAEAVQLEQKAHIEDTERQRRELERKQRRGMILPGEELTQKEKDARLWAFMFHKPTESDMEDDDDDEDDEDWFFDDQDDGRKDQNLTDPDIPDFADDTHMELSDVIRVDESRTSRY